MAEYIDREATLNAIENAFDRETILNRFVRKIAIIAVKKVPAADVRPVVHGYWIDEYIPSTDCDGYHVSRCSVCDWNYPMFDKPYCPNCGADMREVDDG